MRPHRIDWLKACVMAALLVLLAVFARFVFASGITNVLLGGGGISQISTTLTAGNNISGGNGVIGYCATSALPCTSTVGSMSSTNIDGYTIEAAYDLEVSGSITQEYVVISGFSSSPGRAWLGNVTFNSVTFAGSAADYSYSSGTATWEWGTVGGWEFTSGDAYPGTIGYQ